LNSSDCFIVRKASNIIVSHLGYDGAPQHVENQRRLPLEVFADTMLMLPSWIEDVGLLFLHLGKVTHSFPNLHFCIVKTNERSKVLECSSETFPTSHPHQTLIFYVKFKCGIELTNDGLIPIVPKLHHLAKTHALEVLDQVIDAWEFF
jgi:hypothetical protein